METLSYIYDGTEQEVEIGMELYFWQLWDGDGDGQELPESGSISPDNENVVAFKIVETSDDILKTVVKVTDIY